MADTKHYRVLCEENKSRLIALSNTWQKISENPTIPEEAESQIKSVLGKSQLLIQKKFPFFDNFLTKAEEQKQLAVNNDDLHGLWDMITIEIEDLNVKYRELELLKGNNWKQPAVVAKSPKKPIKSPGYSSIKKPGSLVEPSTTASPVTSTPRTTPNRPRSSITKLSPRTTLPNRPKSSIPKPANTGSPATNPRSALTLAKPGVMPCTSTPISSPELKAATKIPQKTIFKSQKIDSTETMTRQSVKSSDEVQSSESEEYFDALS